MERLTCPGRELSLGILSKPFSKELFKHLINNYLEHHMRPPHSSPQCMCYMNIHEQWTVTHMNTLELYRFCLLCWSSRWCTMINVRQDISWQGHHYGEIWPLYPLLEDPRLTRPCQELKPGPPPWAASTLTKSYSNSLLITIPKINMTPPQHLFVFTDLRCALYIAHCTCIMLVQDGCNLFPPIQDGFCL
jgi:hypothetical protein